MGRPSWPGTEIKLSLRENKGSQKPGWPDKIQLQPVNYIIFFIKTMLFWFIKKIMVDPGYLMTQSKPGNPGKTCGMGLGLGQPPGRI